MFCFLQLPSYFQKLKMVLKGEFKLIVPLAYSRAEDKVPDGRLGNHSREHRYLEECKGTKYIKKPWSLIGMYAIL